MRTILKFTLIELLVVVAIIGILVSILMPSLQKARTKAKISVCISNQKQIGIANLDFHGTYDRLPRSGLHWTKHTDTVITDDNQPVPFTVALESTMDGKVRLDTLANMKTDAVNEAYFDVFKCPSHDDIGPAKVYWAPGSGGWMDTISSYGFNEAIVGCSDYPDPAGPDVRPEGNIDAVAYPAEVFMYAEAKPVGWGYIGFYDHASGDLTLQQIYNNSGGGPGGAFDPTRHLYYQTILYVDGHVEAKKIKSKAGVAGVYMKKN